MEVEIKISVPATSGNLGPGFDILGLALDIRNEITLRTTPGVEGHTTLNVSGEGSQELSKVKDNLIVKIIRSILDDFALSHLNLSIEQQNKIPLKRGLGSSATAVASGILAALALAHAHKKTSFPSLDNPEVLPHILDYALHYESHPDNIIPALVGGLCLCWVEEKGHINHLKLTPPSPLACILCIPNVEISTEEARKVLPKSVIYQDVLFNMSRAALFIASLLQNRFDLLGCATQDALHQPYRYTLLPPMESAIKTALSHGALGAFISGSGSTVLALSNSLDQRSRQRIGDEMKNCFSKNGYDSQIMYTIPSQTGSLISLNHINAATPISAK